MHGAILEKWAATGWEVGPLSYPTSDEQGTTDGVGKFNRFFFGSIDWMLTLGAHEVHGAIHDKYASLGFERSVLGYPTTDEIAKPDGVGKFNRFQSGSIYWTPSLGAHEVHGPIHSKYLGWEEGFLGYPTTDEFDGGNRFRVSRFQNGQMNFKPGWLSLKVYTQNMAMMETPPGYAGVDKIMALDTLKAFLKSQKPDIVGFQEMFDDEIRSRLLADSTIASMYPFRSSGPEDGDIVEQDGGLMLLSRFPILERDQIVYRVCAAEDCLANKGALYAKIEIAQGVTYDVFLSHLQNANPLLSSGSERPTVQAQLDLLYSFIEAKRGTQQTPAVMMGDLNTNGNNPTQYNDLIDRLHKPIDVWKTTHPNELGITSDKHKSFAPSEAPVPAGERGKEGSRLDYVFLYDGARFQTNLLDAKVIKTLMQGGKDISDHYGVMAFFNPTQEVDIVYTGTISRVEATLRRFHCFEVTDGSAPLGSDDEVEWRLKAERRRRTDGDGVLAEDQGINVNTNFFFRLRRGWSAAQ